MKPFRDLPIQRKMLVMTLSICGAVLCIAIAALFVFQVLNFRSIFQARQLRRSQSRHRQ